MFECDDVDTVEPMYSRFTVDTIILDDNQDESL